MSIPVTFPASDFPTHTPELLALFDAMNDTRSKLNRALAAGRCAAFRLPEYKASMIAYRAYWRAVDDDKANPAPAPIEVFGISTKDRLPKL